MTYRNEHDLEAILKKLQSAKPADAGAILRAKNIVMAQVRNTQYKLDTNIRNVRGFAVGAWVRSIKFAPALAGVLIVLLGGGGVAAAAQGAVPGDALYGVKIITERVVVKLAPTPRLKVRVETKLAERRAQELKVLQERAVSAPPETKMEIQKNIETLGASAVRQLENAQAHIEELQSRGVPIPEHVLERLEMLEKRHNKQDQLHQLDQLDQQEQQERQEQIEFPPQAATIPILDDETRQFVENAEELFNGLRTQKAELKEKGINIDGGVDAAFAELQTLITKARVFWNDKKFNEVRALEPQIQVLLTRIAHLLNVEDNTPVENSIHSEMPETPE